MYCIRCIGIPFLARHTYLLFLSVIDDINFHAQEYSLSNPIKRAVLEGLLSVKKGGMFEAQKMLKLAAQEFRSEHILDCDEHGEELDYLLHTQPIQISDDEYESDDDLI